MNTTINNGKIHLSVVKAVNTINSATFCFLRKHRPEEKGAIVTLPIDYATVEGEYLRLEKYNNSCDGVGFLLSDIGNISHTTGEGTPTVHFVLNDGEEWIATLCDENTTNYSRQIEAYKEITGDEFLGKLRKCHEVRISHAQEYMSYVATYDTVSIYDSTDDIEHDDDYELSVTLSDSRNYHDNCKINIGRYDTKFHVADWSGGCDYDFDDIFISLPDMPLLSKLCLTLYYEKD